MVSLLLSLWGRCFYGEDDDQQEELPCEEEEDDEICWFLGEILLFYCVAVVILKLLHHGLEWRHEMRCGRVLSSSCWIKPSKGKRGPFDGSKTDSRKEAADCAFCCQLGICSTLRKMFGEKGNAPADSLASSVSTKVRLGKRRSRLSQHTRHGSVSFDSGTLDSQRTSLGISKTEDSPSISGLKEGKGRLPGRARGGSLGEREKPCVYCRAKRTKEWLCQHFCDLPPQEENS